MAMLDAATQNRWSRAVCWRLRAFSFAAFLANATSPALALANQSAKLVYAREAGASSCGDEAALRKAVAQRLGYDPFVAVSENTVVAELRQDGDALRARVFVIEGGSTVGGARELTSLGNHCDELMLALALAISIAIDPEAIERVVEAPATESPAATLPEPSRVHEPRAKPTPRKPKDKPLPAEPKTAFTLRLGLGAFGATGPTPTPAMGSVVAIDVEYGWWSMGIEPRWWAPAQTAPDRESGTRASTSLASVALVPCVGARGWYGCYLAELGRLSSEGDAAWSRRDISAWWGQGLRIAYRLGGSQGLGVAVKLDGLYGATRVKMLLNGAQVFETPRLMGRIGLELSYAL